LQWIEVERLDDPPGDNPMTKSLFRAVLFLAGAIMVAGTALPSAAATLTYNDPNCAGFQITGSGGSFTLTCAKLQCSITGATNPTTAQNTSLTATCTPAGASYLWSLVSGPFSDVTCNAPTSPTSAVTVINKPTGIVAGQTRSCLYQANGTAAPISGQAMATVTWSDAAVSPPVCTPSAVTAPSPITSAGGTVNLNANCAPNAGVAYTWTRTAPIPGQPTNPATATPSDTLAANAGASALTYTWQVVGCISGACDTKSVSVSVPAPGGGGGAVSCNGFGKTVYIDLGWPDFSTLHTQDYGGLNGNDALVMRITPPAGSTSPSGTAGSLNLAEYASPTAQRYAVLSTNPCDFNGIPYFTPPGNVVPILWAGSTTIGLNSIQVNRQDFPSQIKLLPGTVYYLNVKNTTATGTPDACGTGSCNMVIQWAKPPGT
jgi:hypothetical protein